MITDCPLVARFLLHEVVVADCYGLRRLKTAPTAFVDVGANAGMFSVLARMLYPKALVRAYEPNGRTLFSFLEPNTRGLEIDIRQVALGDGAHVCVRTDPSTISDGVESVTLHNSTSAYTVETDGGSVSVPSRPLPDLLDGLDPAETFVKVDCEGAEEHLLDDLSTELLRSCLGFAIEVHGGQRHRIKLPAYRQWVDRLAGNHNLYWSEGPHDTALIRGERP